MTIGTDEFCAFVQRNALWETLQSEEDSATVKRRFLMGSLTPESDGASSTCSSSA